MWALFLVSSLGCVYFVKNVSVYCHVCVSVFMFVQRVCQDAVRGQNMLK